MLHIRLDVFTVSPNKQNCTLEMPTIPATIEPVWKPILIFRLSESPESRAFWNGFFSVSTLLTSSKANSEISSTWL